MIINKKTFVRNFYDLLVPILAIGIFFNLTSALLCLILIFIRLFLIGKNEIVIYLLLFGTGFFGFLFQIVFLPIPGSAFAILISLFLIWDQIPLLMKNNLKSFIFLFLTITVFIVAYLYGPQTAYSREKLKEIIITGFLALIIFLFYTNKSNVNNRDIAQLLLLTSIAYIALSLDYLNYSSPKGLFDFNFFRNSSVYLRNREEFALGYHTPALISLYAIAFLLSSHKTKTPNWLYLIIFNTTAFLIILISGARQGIVGFAVVIAVWYYLKNKRNKMKFVIFLIIFLSAFMVVISSIDSNSIEKMMTAKTLESGLNRDFDRAFYIIKTKSYFGVGLGGYPDISNNYSKYPHNIILEILSEAGLFGLVSCLLITISYLKKINVLNYVTANQSKFFLIFSVYAIRAMISEDLGANVVFFSLMFAMVYKQKT